MNNPNANDPASLGRPYFSNADLSSTPPAKTLVMGYDLPLASMSLVDMNGSEREFQPFP